MVVLGTNLIVVAGGGGGGVTDHGDLDGLTDDDHGNVYAPLVHASRHEVGGDDEVDLAGLSVAITDITEYATGTFTPTFQDSSLSDAESQTYIKQVGRYTRIGNLCYINVVIKINSLGTMTGGDGVILAGLPFASVDAANAEGSFSVGWATSLALGSGENYVSTLIATQNVAYTNLYNWDASGGPTQLTVTELSTNGEFYISGFYEIEPP